MKAYLLNIWDTLRGSYWFLPSLLMLFSVALSIIFPLLDRQLEFFELPDWLETTVPAARSILSVITTSMIAVTGTVFSITVVTLSLTSQQFGPRLLRTFMLDLLTQWTLGIFLATGLYALLVLRMVAEHDEYTQVFHVSVLVAVLMMVCSLALLIVFIHHIAVLIQAPRIVYAVSQDVLFAIDRLFPESSGDEDVSVQAEAVPDEAAWVTLVRSSQEGYIQSLDVEALQAYACKRDTVLQVLYRPGDFLPLHAEFVRVMQPLEEHDSQDINDCVIVGMKRTPRQDFECTISELVEVAVRSLSPGINDPFTAMHCIDRLGAALNRLCGRQMPAAQRFDEEGALRVILLTTDVPALMDAAFNQIRQYGRDSVAVMTRMLEVLNQIATYASRPEDRDAVQRHARMIYEACETHGEANDLQDLEERYQAILQTVSEAHSDS